MLTKVQSIQFGFCPPRRPCLLSVAFIILWMNFPLTLILRNECETLSCLFIQRCFFFSKGQEEMLAHQVCMVFIWKVFKSQNKISIYSPSPDFLSPHSDCLEEHSLRQECNFVNLNVQKYQPCWPYQLCKKITACSISMWWILIIFEAERKCLLLTF